MFSIDKPQATQQSLEWQFTTGTVGADSPALVVPTATTQQSVLTTLVWGTVRRREVRRVMVINSHKPTARNSAGLWKFSPVSTPLASMWCGGRHRRSRHKWHRSVFCICIRHIWTWTQIHKQEFSLNEKVVEPIPVGMSTVGHPSLWSCREKQDGSEEWASHYEGFIRGKTTGTN